MYLNLHEIKQEAPRETALLRLLALAHLRFIIKDEQKENNKHETIAKGCT